MPQKECGAWKLQQTHVKMRMEMKYMEGKAQIIRFQQCMSIRQLHVCSKANRIAIIKIYNNLTRQ